VPTSPLRSIPVASSCYRPTEVVMKSERFNDFFYFTITTVVILALIFLLEWFEARYRPEMPSGQHHFHMYVFIGFLGLVAAVSLKKYTSVRDDFHFELCRLKEKLRAEEALREKEARYQLLFNKANDAIYVFGVTTSGDYGNFMEVNDNLCKLVGYTKEELKSLTIMDVIAPEAREEILGGKEVLFTEKHLLAERMMIKKSGERIPVEVSAHLFEVNGENTILSIVRDISERKKSEEKLRQSEENYRKMSQKFESLSKAINDSLVLLSPELKVIWSNNDRAYQVDAPIKELIGRYCYEIFYNRAEPCEDCPVVRSFESGTWETQFASSLTGKLLEKRAFPILESKAVENVILIISDVTDKIKMQAEAMEASHMASLGELAAGVAHEINNPINGIINYAQVLINETPSDSVERDIGQRILKEGERTAGIVKSLLSFARGDREVKSPIRIEDVLKESLSLTHAQIRKDGITLKTLLPEDLPRVVANFHELQQVFLNVINNARYAIQEKFPGRDEKKVIEITGKGVVIEGTPFVETTFYDQGVGIAADKLQMLSMPFFSTKPIGKGTGLGLAIANRIISDHGGKMNFDSVEGEYTRVKILLPVEEG
jgi:PAS domain S-box-containing protein